MLTGGKAFYRLILNRSDWSIIDNAGNTFTAIFFVLINLGAGNNFTICSLQIKLNAIFCLRNYEFTYFVASFKFILVSKFILCHQS